MINRAIGRSMFRTSVLLLFFVSSLGVGAKTAIAESPNIVFILSDDQGYGDLGCYGSTKIETPNIDSLARDGMKFESFYVHNRCSPSRAAFLTGCIAERVGINKVVYRRDKIGLHSDELTAPSC